MAGNRLGYKKGDYLVQTDGLGVIAHRSECAIQYDNQLKLKENLDPRHPAEVLRAKKDLQAVKDPRPISEAKYVFITSVDDI